MPAEVKPLDPDAVYVDCPICKSQGTPHSPLRRDSVGKIQCAFGHSPNILLENFGTKGLAPMTADAVKGVDFYTEKPNITDIKWPIWVDPELKQKMEEKFKGRVFATITVLLAALVDGNLLMITGEVAAELRKHGLKNGQEILAFVQGAKEIERERGESIAQLEKLQNVLKNAGVA